MQLILRVDTAADAFLFPVLLRERQLDSIRLEGARSRVADILKGWVLVQESLRFDRIDALDQVLSMRLELLLVRAIGGYAVLIHALLVLFLVLGATFGMNSATFQAGSTVRFGPFCRFTAGLDEGRLVKVLSS